MTAELLNGPNAAMILAGVAAFAGIAAFALPVDESPRLRARLQSVARERGRLREKRLAELAIRNKRAIRKEESGLLQRLVWHFKREERSANGDLAIRLRMAGFRGPGAETVFLFFRAFTPLLLTVIGLAVLSFYSRTGILSPSSLSVCIAMAALGYSLPRLILERLIARRQKVIIRAFPDALDLLLICVQSGMSVESALGRTTKDISSQCIELAEELSLTMAELSYLPVRWRAYANLGERVGLPAVKLITAALIQAERHGTSIGQALTAAAQEGREARITEAERKAASLPPKLAVPLVVFFLPVLLTIILAPALIQAGDALRKESGSIIAKRLQKPPMHPPGGRSSRTGRDGDGR